MKTSRLIIHFDDKPNGVRAVISTMFFKHDPVTKKLHVKGYDFWGKFEDLGYEIRGSLPIRHFRKIKIIK